MKGLWLFVAIALLAGCSNELSGSFEVKSDDGTLSFKPTACNSGERKNYYGVELFVEDDESKGLRVVDGPEGVAIFFSAPGQSKPALLQEAVHECSKFDVTVEEQNSEINDVTNVMGHVRVDCEVPGVGQVKADISFENCH